jgi:hypothetical protein
MFCQIEEKEREERKKLIQSSIFLCNAFFLLHSNISLLLLSINPTLEEYNHHCIALHSLASCKRHYILLVVVTLLDTGRRKQERRE